MTCGLFVEQNIILIVPDILRVIKNNRPKDEKGLDINRIIWRKK